MTEKINWVTISVAIISLAVIEVVALCNGINGTMMTIVIAAIAGLVGWSIPIPKQLV